MTTPWLNPPADDIVISPNTGGLFHDNTGNTIAWCDFDPDQKILSYSYDATTDPDNPSWIVNTGKLRAHLAWTKQKGPVHIGQFRPTGIKDEAKTRERCTTYHSIKFNGFNPNKTGTINISLHTYKEQLRKHMIDNGMFHLFLMPDPIIPNKTYDLFRNHSRFTLDQVKDYHAIRENNNEVDNYELQNLTYSGIYIRDSVGPELLHQIFQEIGTNAIGPTTFIIVM